LRIKHIVFGAALPRGLASGSAHAGAGTSQDGAAEWLGLAAGPPAAAETLLAADLADLFATARPLRVLTLLGDAGARNIALLMVMSLDQKEALFKKFIEWQRSSENQRASLRNEGTEGAISQFM
jgi:hypothetical protein